MGDTIESERAIKRERSRRYRERNREAIREKARSKRASDLEGHRRYHREYARRWKPKDPEQHREKRRSQSAVWRAANPEYRRKIGLKRHGLTPDQYDAMLAAQNGSCAICGATSPRSKNSKRMFVDHCHVTGRIRGLLCSPCNTMLGLATDSPTRLRAAAEYLERLSTSPAHDTWDHLQEDL